MPHHTPLGFDHKKMKHLGIHYSENGVGVHDVKKQFHGHAFVIKPSEMSGTEFANAIGNAATYCPSGRGIVLFQPAPFKEKWMKNSSHGTHIMEHPTMKSDFLIIKDEDLSERERNNLKKRMDGSQVDVHIGDVSVGEKDKAAAMMHLLSEFSKK